ncbi:MAG: hypothetical protein EP329_23900 [Deltaproteobacteria bacterium]|nr:MAG: hypothetical protein EP329_23900 [Deltaproteobacteria bacterium]
MIKHVTTALFALLLAASAAQAAVPTRLAVQGTLRDDFGIPVDQAVDMTFTLYESGDPGAAALWTETQSVTVDAGRFTVHLGAVTPLDPADFADLDTATLGVAIAPDGEIGRMPLASVVFAQVGAHASDARAVGGLTAADLARSGQACPAGQHATGFDADGVVVCAPDDDTTYDGGDFATSDQGCPAGQVATGFDAAGALVCAVDGDTTYDGGDFGASDQACGAGLVARGFDAAGAVVCGADVNTTYDGADFVPSTQSCPAGQLVTGVGATGAVSCATDANTTYSGAQFMTSGQDCGAGSALTGVDAGGARLCAVDQDTNTTYSGADFVTSNQSCPATSLATGAGATGAVVCQDVTAWDRAASDDLTTTTSFGGAVTGTYAAMSLATGAVTPAKLANAYLPTSGGTMTGTLTLGSSGVDFGHGGRVSFGACGSGSIPSGWSQGNATGRGFCMRAAADATNTNNQTLFITSQGTGSSVEAIYIGSGLTCCGPDWLGMRIGGDGNVSNSGTFTANTLTPSYSDLAERVPVTGPIAVGEVVVVEGMSLDYREAKFARASRAYDPTVLGVVSDTVAFAMGPEEGRSPVALAGFVKVKVDAAYGAIAPGDLLVSSATPGHAMRSAKDVPGTVLGKALQPWSGGRGVIMMLVLSN